MPSPMFNESTIKQAKQTWAPPEPGTDFIPPMTDGPVSTWKPGVMTVNGTISAAAVLFVLLLISATFGWIATDSNGVDVNGNQIMSFPTMAWVGLGVGFIAVIALFFKPHLAKILGPIYALAQGFFLGALSKAYESLWDGIVVQAALATISVFFVMLVLYRTQIIKVTDKFRRIVVGATLGIMVLYGVSFLIMLFGGNVSFLTSPSLLGIGFSILVCGIAAMNLALDFDFIERGSREGLSKDFEWYAAFALLVTIIWLYMEMLRLLAKLRQN
jgi:uncharacterized YccA/Bax inhibitor family protein